MSEERPFPEVERRRIRRYQVTTAAGFAAGVVVAYLVAWRAAGSGGEIPVDSTTAVGYLPFALVFVWAGYRSSVLAWGWPCPACSARLSAAPRASRSGTVRLTCRECGIDWDTGIRADSPPT